MIPGRPLLVMSVFTGLAAFGADPSDGPAISHFQDPSGRSIRVIELQRPALPHARPPGPVEPALLEPFQTALAALPPDASARTAEEHAARLFESLLTQAQQAGDAQRPLALVLGTPEGMKQLRRDVESLPAAQSLDRALVGSFLAGLEMARFRSKNELPDSVQSVHDAIAELDASIAAISHDIQLRGPRQSGPALDELTTRRSLLQLQRLDLEAQLAHMSNRERLLALEWK